MDESLWSCRNVAEYAYCPRLFYFMEVEGVFIPNADTEKGKAVHRRVDNPSAQKAENDEAGTGEEDPEKPRVVRSLVLASQALGLTATLDLTEINGKTAIPVEYRKGKPLHRSLPPPPDDPFESEESPIATSTAWPTDRIQLGLQSLLLMEAGYSVPEAIIYYASEKRRLVLPVDEALLAESRGTLEAAKACARGARPSPLVNDPRCLRCSLQPICLPDEINLQRGERDASPRQIWPPRDDGIHVVAQLNGSHIGIKGTTLSIKDREGKLVKEIPLVNVESLSLLGSVPISPQAIHALADRDVPVAFLSAAGRLVAILDPMDSVSAEIRREQVRILDRPEACLELARALITAKIANQRTLLKRNHPSLPVQVSDGMAQAIDLTEKANDLEEIRGHEGRAAALYFDLFAGMIKSPLAAEFDANGRQRRPPPDPINSCLSMAYVMLTHECVAALRLAHLEPAIGAFHISKPGRPALALDLMEPFRPLIADSVAISAFNKGELTEGHFTRTAAGCMFTDPGRKAFFNAYGRRMETEITHPVFGYRLSYRRMLVLHARMLAAWMIKDTTNLAFLTTR